MRNKDVVYSFWMSQKSTLHENGYFTPFLTGKKYSEDVPMRICLCKFHDNTEHFIISSGFLLYTSIKYLKTWVQTINY